MTVALVAGTRPELIKLAPVYRALQKLPGAPEPKLIAVGQQRDLVPPHLLEIGIEPSHRVCLKTDNVDNGLSTVLGDMITAIGPVLDATNPKMVLVQGDTTTALAATLAAFYEGYPVGHVEAGLRTNKLYAPFPEEGNRRLISRFAVLHFAPTASAVENLRRENITEGVSLTGNTIVDDLYDLYDEPLNTGLLKVLVTCHRREGWFTFLPEMAMAAKNLDPKRFSVFWPLHPNPGVRATVRSCCENAGHVLLQDPLDRREFVEALSECDVVVTDSGGVIEEAVSLEKPVLILREETERPESIECGLGSLVSCDDLIKGRLGSLIEEAATRRIDPEMRQPFGDGHAGERIAKIVADYLATSDTKREPTTLKLCERPSPRS